MKGIKGVAVPGSGSPRVRREGVRVWGVRGPQAQTSAAHSARPARCIPFCQSVVESEVHSGNSRVLDFNLKGRQSEESDLGVQPKKCYRIESLLGEKMYRREIIVANIEI